MDNDNSKVVALLPALRAAARCIPSNAGEAYDLVELTLAKALANVGQLSTVDLQSALVSIMKDAFTSAQRRSARWN